jgi:heptosyltransferase-1
MKPIELPSPPRRVLIIKPSAIGDVVHALPVLNLVRRAWPGAYIAWLVTPACAGLLEDHPQLNEVIRFERKRFGQGWKNPAAAIGLFRFARQLRSKQFDLVIDLQGLFRSGWLAWQTRAPIRIGFANAREFAPLFYTHRVPIDTPEQHAVDRYLMVTDALGCGREPIEFRFAPTREEDQRAVAKLLKDEPSPYAVLLPGTNWATKRWPVEHFASVVAPLRERFGLRTVVAGAASDRELASRINGTIDLTGATSLSQLVTLLQGASVVVANDSGPMHIASALGLPLVTPYGPTSPVRTGPYGRADTVVRLDIVCSPCFSRTCSHQSCLQWLGPQHVVHAIERQLAAATAQSGSGAARSGAAASSPPPPDTPMA